LGEIKVPPQYGYVRDFLLSVVENKASFSKISFYKRLKAIKTTYQRPTWYGIEFGGASNPPTILFSSSNWLMVLPDGLVTKPKFPHLHAEENNYLV